MIILTLPVAVAALALSAWIARELLFWTYPVEDLKTQYPVVEYSKEQVKVTLEKKRPASWVNYSQISKSVIHAVIVSEDWSFFDHEGYDLEELKASVEKNLKKGKFARGGSTITQQTVKNVFLSGEKSLWRKLKEFLLAVKMEEILSKQKILEIYFNVVEFDRGVYGITHASRHYFGKSPNALNPREAAFLALLLPSPKKYSVSFHKKELTPFARGRIRDILGKMAKARFISAEDKSLWLNSTMSFETKTVAADLVTQELEKELNDETTEETPEELLDETVELD